jgi:hypothetical protein
MTFKEPRFDRRRIIFRQARDVLEQPGTGEVVEPARGDGFLALGKAAKHISPEGKVGPVLVMVDKLEIGMDGHVAGFLYTTPPGRTFFEPLE